MVAAAARTSAHEILESDSGWLRIGGVKRGWSANASRTKSDAVTVVVEIESTDASSVIISDIAPEPLVGGDFGLEAGRIGDKGAGDFG